MRTRASIIVLGALLLAAPASATDPVSKMYDLRDLAGVLPANSSAAAAPSSDPFAFASRYSKPRTVPVLSNIPIISHVFTLPADPTPAPSFDPIGSGRGGAPAANDAGQSPTDELVNKLCGLLALSNAELVDNVYFIEGEEAAHGKFANAIESVRSLYQDRVQIEVSCFDVDAQQSPNIGDAVAKTDKPAMSAKAVGVRKTLTRVEATRSISYIARWTAIVADSAVGLEPGTASVTEGLVLGVRITSGPREKQRVSVQGTIAKAEITSVQVPSDQIMASGNTTLSPGGPLVTIGLPRVDARTVDTDVALELNRPTVVATLPGFKEGRQIVVAVTLKQAE